MTQPGGLPPKIIGRYALHDEIAHGGMATVHLGRLLGPVGFSRTVAIKRLHPQLAKDTELVTMFVDEARLAARIRHPHVIPTLDVVSTDGELFLVMEYVHGESLARLVRTVRERGELVPLPIASAIVVGALLGLHAAHEATDETGAPLHLVHRDVSPQNVLVGVDGVPRVFDFGVARSRGQIHTTKDDNVRGKLPYMAPEVFQGRPIDRRADVWAAGVVLWELLANASLFHGDNEGQTIERVLLDYVEAPSDRRREVPSAADEVVLRALERSLEYRFETALDMALALEAALRPASAREVAEWLVPLARASLDDRAARVATIEREGATDRSIVLDAVRTVTRPADAAVSTSSVPPKPPDRLGSPTRLVFGLAIVLAAVATIVFGRRSEHAARVEHDAVASTVEATSSSTSGSSAFGARASGTMPPGATAYDATPTGAASSGSPPTPPALTPSASAPAPSHHRPPPAPPAPNKIGVAKPKKEPPNGSACSPPFVLDSLGRKIYKRECL